MITIENLKNVLSEIGFEKSDIGETINNEKQINAFLW